MPKRQNYKIILCVLKIMGIVDKTDMMLSFIDTMTEIAYHSNTLHSAEKKTIQYLYSK